MKVKDNSEKWGETKRRKASNLGEKKNCIVNQGDSPHEENWNQVQSRQSGWGKEIKRKPT